MSSSVALLAGTPGLRTRTSSSTNRINSFITAYLKRLFARKERRKVSREATVRYHNRHFKVPDDYIGWHVWVANLLDQHIEIRAVSSIVGTFEL